MVNSNDKLAAAKESTAASITWALDPHGDSPPPLPIVHLTVEEVALVLRRSSKSIYRRIRCGRLRARLEGGQYLIHPSALRDYLRRL